MEPSFGVLRRLIQRRQTLWWASLLPLTAVGWAIWLLPRKNTGYVYGGKELYAYMRHLPTHADYTVPRFVAAGAVWFVKFAVLNTARVRFGSRSMAYTLALTPIFDLVTCSKPFLVGEAGVEDACILLFHFPGAVGACVAAHITYTSTGPLREWRLWVRFCTVWYAVCCSLLYLWSGGRAARYPISFGPVERAVATQVVLAMLWLCMEFHEKIVPRSLQRTPVIQLAEIDGGELMPVPEARTPTHANPRPSPHTT